jgi:hypothetical protein
LVWGVLTTNQVKAIHKTDFLQVMSALGGANKSQAISEERVGAFDESLA